MRKLENLRRRFERRDIINYNIHCCDNIAYLLIVKRKMRDSYDMTPREYNHYCHRIDGIIRRQLGRMKAREYLEMLEK
jgi:hypothetical protein